MTDAAARPARARVWWIAARPWALPASMMPVVFGSSLAVVAGGARLNVFRFALSLLAMAVLHTAANMLSDANDFDRGLDREVTPVSGAIVRGWLPSRRVRSASLLLFAAGTGLGIVLAGMTGWSLVAVGAAGIAIGAGYTLLKASALGDLAVFLDFGVLGALGAWIVQTRSFSWLPAVGAVPMAMLVSAILQANNWRDIATDSACGVRTFASVLGDRGSLVYYGSLVFGSMGLVAVFILIPRFLDAGWPALPWTSAIVFLGLPRALALWGRAARRRAPRNPMDFVVLDGATARYNLVFGLLLTAGLWLGQAIR